MPEDNKLEIYNEKQDGTWFKNSSIGLGLAGTIVNIVIVSLGLIWFIISAMILAWADSVLADLSLEWSISSYSLLATLRSNIIVYIILGFVSLGFSIAILVLIKRKNKSKVFIGGIFEIVLAIIIFALIILNLALAIATASMFAFFIVLSTFIPLTVAGVLMIISGIEICVEYKKMNGENKNTEPQV